VRALTELPMIAMGKIGQTALREMAAQELGPVQTTG
jgi:hypothetical protein